MFLSFTEKMLLAFTNFFDAFEYKTMKKVIYPEFYDALAKKLNKGKNQIKKNLYEFKRRGYIQTKFCNGQKIFFITPKGYSTILQIKLKLKKKKQKPDGKLRIIIFDIAEKEKIKRDFFRTALKSLGFKQLQKSVWFSLYDVFDELAALVKICGLENNVKFILATEIQDEF